MVRNVLASISCNCGQCHWKHPAQWSVLPFIGMGDLGQAIALSWQSGAAGKQQ